MKVVSWNVNGIRACVKKGFLDYFHEVDADIFCIQESKLQEGQIALELPGYEQYWNYAEKKGYSGTAVFTKKKPIAVHYGVGEATSQVEGRLLTLEYDDFYLVNVYTPNAQRELARIDYRLEWEDAFRAHLLQLNERKPVLLCGDLNVAHQEIDLKNPKANKKNPGFSPQEREKMNALLDSGFIDTFRYFYPEKENMYTWWSYMGKSRERNIGWRIDYWIVSEVLKEKLVDAHIHSHIYGSDHCPVVLELETV